MSAEVHFRRRRFDQCWFDWPQEMAPQPANIQGSDSNSVESRGIVSFMIRKIPIAPDPEDFAAVDAEYGPPTAIALRSTNQASKEGFLWGHRGIKSRHGRMCSVASYLTSNS
jgi:hypothetical protein